MEGLIFTEAVFQNGWLCFKTENRGMAMKLLYTIQQGKRYILNIKKFRKKRSLDANAYCWVLISKIAAEMSVDKLDVYREAIRSIGGNSDTVCIKEKAAPMLRKCWEQKGLGWLTETAPSKLKGCENVTLYYGSSVYDTKQMSLLIDHLIQDAQALGIPAETPERLALLLEGWGK